MRRLSYFAYLSEENSTYLIKMEYSELVSSYWITYKICFKNVFNRKLKDKIFDQILTLLERASTIKYGNYMVGEPDIEI